MWTLIAVLSIVTVVLNGHPLPHESNLRFLMNDDEHMFIFGQKAANNADLQDDVQYELSEAVQLKSYTLETVVTLHTSDDSFMVLLSPRRNLISSNLRLISSGDDDHVQDISSVDWRECLWEGTVLSHTDAVAAFSNCDNQGLRGVIVTRDAQYFVHPVPKRLRGRRELPQSVAAKLIVFAIRKTTSTSGNLDFCSVQSDFNDHHEIVKRETEGGSSTSVKVIETAVFIDSELQVWAAKQAETNSKLAITELVFALMNSVQAIYDHPSMETKFKFVLVHLEVIDDPTSAPAKSDGRITEYLNSFCIWQSDGSRGNRNWDHAILLSGLDLYAKEPSDSKAMGMAWVSGMCRETLSCTINEGNTFQSIYVISHEIGHNLGMQHDGKENDCDPNLYIMSATLGPGRTQWSSCSNKYVSTFLQRPQASCLNNEATPLAELDFARSKFPGQMFPADQQCIIAYGETYHPFVDPEQPPYDDICRVLWCANETHAQSTLRTLDGTVCDANKVCMYGACVGLDTIMTTSATTRSWTTQSATTASATPMQCTCPSQHSGTSEATTSSPVTSAAGMPTPTIDRTSSATTHLPSSEANTATTPLMTNEGVTTVLNSPSSIATTLQTTNQETTTGTSTLATVLTGTTPSSTPEAASSPATTTAIQTTLSQLTTAVTSDHGSTFTTAEHTTPASLSSGTTLDHSLMLTTAMSSTESHQSSVAMSATETSTVITPSSATVPTTVATTLEHPNQSTDSTALTSDSTPALTTIVSISEAQQSTSATPVSTMQTTIAATSGAATMTTGLSTMETSQMASTTETTSLGPSSISTSSNVITTTLHSTNAESSSTVLTSGPTASPSPTLTGITSRTAGTQQSASATSPIETTTALQTTPAGSSTSSGTAVQTTIDTTLDHPRTESSTTAALTSGSTSVSSSTSTIAMSTTATSQTPTETTTIETTTTAASTTFTTPVSVTTALITTRKPEKTRTTASNSPVNIILDKMDEKAQERLDQQIGSIDFDPDVFLSMQEYLEVEAVSMKPHEAPLVSWTQQRTHCSKACGTGERNVEYVCVDSVGTPSNHCMESLKPQNHTESCNTHACATLEWHVQGWTECNVTCGDGFQSVVSVCVAPLDASNYDVVPDENCYEQKTLKRPVEQLRACGKICKDNH